MTTQAAPPDEAIAAVLAQARASLVAAAGAGDTAAMLRVRQAAQHGRALARGVSPRLAMDAEELQRRAERALAVAVRRGQAAGTIRIKGESSRTGKPSPHELIGRGGTLSETYQLADGVTTAQFERALAAARADGSVSRRAIIHKLRGTTARPTGRPPAGRASPGPLPDYARDAAWQLRKSVERVERVFADDRFPATKTQVTTHLHGHLAYAAQVCTDLVNRLNSADRSLTDVHEDRRSRHRAGGHVRGRETDRPVHSGHPGPGP